ncbi:hypothetical protein BDZ94DRAFT_1265220, partial [Collybia nuda]
MYLRPLMLWKWGALKSRNIIMTFFILFVFLSKWPMHITILYLVTLLTRSLPPSII